MENISTQTQQLISKLEKVDRELARQLKQKNLLSNEEQKMLINILDFDENAAKRLVILAIKASGENAKELLALQMSDYINPESIEISAFEKYGQWPWYLSLAEWLRNILVLFPITLTWYELSLAAINYANLIKLYPDLIEKPFLLLWENKFNNINSRGMNFSNLAMTDFYFLAIVIFITIGVHFWRDLWQVNAEKKSINIRKQLENYLSTIEDNLFSERFRHTGSKQIQQFEDAIKAFDTQSKQIWGLAGENLKRVEALSKEREKELTRLTEFSTNFQTGIIQMRQQTDAISPTYNRIQNIVEKFREDLHQNDQQQKSLNASLASIATDLNTVTQNFRNIELGIKTASEFIAVSLGTSDREKATSQDALDKLSALLERLTENEKTVRDAIFEIAKNGEKTNNFINDTIAKIQNLDEHLKLQSAEADVAIKNMVSSVQNVSENVMQNSSDFMLDLLAKNQRLDEYFNEQRIKTENGVGNMLSQIKNSNDAIMQNIGELYEQVAIKLQPLNESITRLEKALVEFGQQVVRSRTNANGSTGNFFIFGLMIINLLNFIVLSIVLWYIIRLIP